MQQTGAVSPAHVRVASRGDLPPPLLEQQFEAWNAYSMPEMTQLFEGTWCLPLPLAGSSLGFVYCYALAVDDGVVLIDTGAGDSGIVDLIWQQLAAIGFGPQDLRAILCTHYHRDHYGNVATLQQTVPLWVGLHAADVAVLADLSASNRMEQELLWKAMGIESVDDEAQRNEGNPFGEIPAGRPDRVLLDGDVLQLGGRTLRVVWTPGHSPGHVCFFEESAGVLFAGDHLLPRISSGVTLLTVQRRNPLADYLGSLTRLSALPVTTVLPGHEYAFQNLKPRIAALEAHHQERLREILDAVRSRPGASSAEISALVTWSRPWPRMTGKFGRMAIAETAAHLVYLEGQGVVVKSQTGPVRWSQARDALALMDSATAAGAEQA